MYWKLKNNFMHKDINDILATLPLDEMSGEDKFLSVATIISDGQVDFKISMKEVALSWSHSLLGKYSSTYYARACKKGYIIPMKDKDGQIKFVITSNGLNKFQSLKDIINVKEIRKSGKLIIFDKKQTHSFDKFIRDLFKNVKREILIADSYVDQSLFDNFLDGLPNTTIIKVLYANDSGLFSTRANRFKSQYQKFETKEYKDLHDRFIIVDGIGYIIGPSIKDAASNSPAIVVALATEESKLLEDFFREIWKLGR